MRPRLRKILVGVSALAALALGATAISQAGSSTPPQKSPEPATEQEQTAPENSATDPDNVQEESGEDDSSEKGEEEESDKPVTGDAASRAKQAAVAETGGKAGDVERDSENGATYEVEVTKADGKQVDVYLDDQYKVVAVDQDDEQSDESAEQAGATK